MNENYLIPSVKMVVPSPVGDITVAASELGLTHLTMCDSRVGELRQVSETDKQKAHKILELVAKELQEYFTGARQSFETPLAPKGTVFQKEVWQALLTTAHGQTLSYSDIANVIERPKAVRAVGAANGANNIAIIIPCHRIIGKSGKLTGYAYGLEMKQYLLELENA